jgi:Tn3 transposase DDE domain
MIKYAAALRLGTAETEAILRRFTRNNLKHPTYRALAELGKADKTIFLCRYLRTEALRREILEGLNVIENWNGANDFIYYGKGGEIRLIFKPCSRSCPECNSYVTVYLLIASPIFGSLPDCSVWRMSKPARFTQV